MPAFPDNIGTWSYKTRHVQTLDGTNDYSAGDFPRGASIIFCAGPRRKPDTLTASNLIPIGLLQTGSIAEQKQLEEVFEIGSERRYFITGRTFFNLQIARILVDKGSLLRAVYNDASGVSQNLSDKDRPGDNDYWLNLASTWFNTPTGILVIDNSNDNRIIGAAYLEDCYINNYNRQIAAPQTVVAEQCTIRFDAIAPVSKTEIDPLIAASAF